MIRRVFAVVCVAGLGGCGSGGDGNCIVNQQFVHKYGFNVSPQEWEAREGDGQIVETLKNGVKITRSYEGGELHGQTTFTFPHSNVVEKLQSYDQGTLLKEVVYDGTGMPLREEVYEFDNRTIVTLWDEKGAPLSIEEYDGELLAEGKYYTPGHDIEGQVIDGRGERVRRERSGSLVAREEIAGGIVATRTTYHSTGEMHTVSHYDGDQLHGEQRKYSANGMPLMKLEWNHGVLDGIKVVYRNGYKVAEIPYVNGKKMGTEKHFDDLGHLTAQIEWKNDKKHGCSQGFTDETVDLEWYYKGQVVTREKYDAMTARDLLVADLNGSE